ncbi:MAG: ATP-binding cassette domain-containing protein [Lachnospiraceae bacterium]|nr:ATP-binding cassette domain-containing protein [Lachnospiraceae bacterium]
MSILVQTNQLVKQFKDHKAVDSVNLKVEKGDVYGFIGQNGAGKTTTIRLLLGLLSPTSGGVELFGDKIFNTNIHKYLPRIGAMIETPGFYLNLSGAENLDIHRLMMKVKDKDSIQRAMKIVHLEDVGKKKVKEYSMGMKQRLGIARALLHNPELLILDEPTNGLDPRGIIEIRDLIIDIAKKHGKTVLISSHILDEVERMVNKIGIINKGKLLAEGHKEELIGGHGKSLVYKVDNIDKAVEIIRDNHLFDGEIKVEENSFFIFTDNDTLNSKITKLLVENQINVYESKIISPSLENYFLELVEKGEV